MLEDMSKRYIVRTLITAVLYAVSLQARASMPIPSDPEKGEYHYYYIRNVRSYSLKNTWYYLMLQENSTIALCTGTVKSERAIWYFVKKGDNYYVVNVNNGYIYSKNRTSGTTVSLSKKNKSTFAIASKTVENNTGYYIANPDNTGLGLNPFGGLTNNNIAYFSTTDGGSVWEFDEVVPDAPTISFSSDDKVEITSNFSSASIYYTTDGTDPSTSSIKYDAPFTMAEAGIVKAIVVYNNVSSSTSVAYYFPSSTKSPEGGDPTPINSLSEITNPTGNYILNSDVSGGSIPLSTFYGKLDGNGFTISGLSSPLCAAACNAIFCNINIENVEITSGSDVGAFVGLAYGNTRVYNCGVLSGSVNGTNSVGSLVGVLGGSARVINCFSYADVTGGTDVGGIVGYNNYASTANDLRTMVMNCMYYGSITGGTNKSPVYGGQKITNAGSAGLNNYNYYSYANNSGEFTSYNVALAAEDKYLTRHEFYRGILNSTRGLCAYYIFGDALQTSGIYRWVVDWNDAEHPYPVLKPQGTTVYNSTVNRFVTDASNAIGYLTVVVNDGHDNTKTMTLPITPKDEKHYDYSYGKVVLPFYNTIEGFSGNYTNNKVVTGWDIVSVSGGTQGTLETTGDNAYNFADRKCTVKDKGRVFAQGGYYYVPDGVTSITIKAHWGQAVYLSDAYYDVVYSTGYTAYDFTNYDFTKAGARPTTFNSQPVYTTLNAAMNKLTSVSTVYDQAIVLVGNYHSLTGDNKNAWIGNNYPFTLMSVDLDNNNEPDYCMFHQHHERKDIAPIRFDFLWHPGVGMAHRMDGTGRMPNQGIFHANGWFEITETALARYTEFEYGYGDNTPMILNNGIFDQFVSRHDEATTQKSYMILGGNLYMQCFSPGVHPDNSGATTHCPVTVLGGEFKEFYLSGTYRPNATVSQSDNASCYIDGGKFGTVAGAGQEQIDGDVFFKVNHAEIDEFYGGGINAVKPITGDIQIVIDNSHVVKYCGGPKFGDVQGGKHVVTSAEGTQFDAYYGAGNGGTSLYRTMPKSNYELSFDPSSTFATWVTESYTNPGGYTSGRGVLVQPDYEFFTWAGGSSDSQVGRYYMLYASFSKATTRNVTSSLTKCKIGNYYGGGMIGQVDGEIASSLTDCTVTGNVFGGGFSASVPTVDVYSSGDFTTYPKFDANAGVYVQGVFGTPVTYTWAVWDAAPTDSYLNDTNNTIYTSSLDGLGQVSGKIKLEITGGSVGGSVYGGGDESESQNNTEVVITNATITGNVFGGGNKAKVGQNTTVRILGSTTVEQNVYGGGNEAEVGGTTTVQIGDKCVTTSTNSENGGE